jgi:hypothetical protein
MGGCCNTRWVEEKTDRGKDQDGEQRRDTGVLFVEL